MALYVRPLDNSGLRRALEQSFAASPLPLMQHIHKHFTWSKVAEKTLAAYRTMIEDHEPKPPVRPNDEA